MIDYVPGGCRLRALRNSQRHCLSFLAVNGGDVWLIELQSIVFLGNILEAKQSDQASHASFGRQNSTHIVPNVDLPFELCRRRRPTLIGLVAPTCELPNSLR